MITTLLIIQNQLKIKYLLRAVVMFGLISTVIALSQLFEMSISGKSFFISALELNSRFGHKNLLSSVLFLVFPFILISIIKVKRHKALLVGLGVIILLLTWLVQTKAVIVAFVVFFFVLLFMLFRYRVLSKRILVRLTVTLFLFIVIISGFTFLNRQKFSRIFDSKSSLERIAIWKNSVEMIKENFIFGVGAGNWQIEFPKYGLDKFAESAVKNGMTTFQRPHNDYLWVFCETGFWGLLAYLFIFATILFYLLRIFKRRRGNKDYWMFFIFLATVLGYLLIAFVDFPLERIEHQVLLYTTFAIIAAHYYKNVYMVNPPTRSEIKGPALFILLILSLLFSFTVCIKRATGAYHTQRLYLFKQQSNWEKLIDEADKSINLFYSVDPMSAPIVWYKGVALFTSGNMEAAKTCFEQANLIHPYHIHVLNNLGSCYEKLNDHKKAEEMYLRALAISSEFEEARLNLSAVYFNGKEFEKAFKTIDNCSVNSTDEKYKLFLPAILNSWIELQLFSKNDLRYIDTLNSLKNNKERTLKLYFESKAKRANFMEYVLANAQPNFQN